jgi:lipocalin
MINVFVWISYLLIFSLQLVYISSYLPLIMQAPYWILELGPVNSNNLYDYAIVSDNFSAYLFVLARDVATYNSKYKADVENTLKQLGFTGKTAPIDTYHGADCVYESSMRRKQIEALALAK